MNTRFCVNCGTAVPAGSNFCPKCGTELPDLLETIPAYVPPVAAPPAVAAAPPPVAPPTESPRSAPPVARTRPSALMIGVPIAMLVLGLVIWALLAGMPFGGDRLERREGAKFDTITEGDAPAGSNNRELIVEGEERPAVPPPATTTVPPLVPAPVTTAPPPDRAPAEPPSGEISQDEAASTLRAYIASRDDYGVSSDCASVSPVEYRNAGYTLDVSDTCDRRSLGRWRVDAKTREVFRQNDDGRFLRP